MLAARMRCEGPGLSGLLEKPAKHGEAGAEVEEIGEAVSLQLDLVAADLAGPAAAGDVAVDGSGELRGRPRDTAKHRARGERPLKRILQHTICLVLHCLNRVKGSPNKR